jgi:hypothetical protein
MGIEKHETGRSAMALVKRGIRGASVKDFLKTVPINTMMHLPSAGMHLKCRKIHISAACIALFLIGAPLGAIIRKGGLGLPVVISVIFFLIYYIISTIGEKSVKAGNVSTVFGMWVAIIVLTPIGLFLSYKAATDSVIFDMESYKRYFIN